MEYAPDSIEFADPRIDLFVRGLMSDEERLTFVTELQTNDALRRQCTLHRESLSVLEVSISSDAGNLFRSAISKLSSANRHFPGAEYVRGQDNSSHIIHARERLYADAIELFVELIALGELADLAITNLHIARANQENARRAAAFYEPAGFDHGAAIVALVQGGMSGVTDAVFGHQNTPFDSAGQCPPVCREEVPLRLQPDTRSIEQLLLLDVTQSLQAQQLVRRLNECCPQTSPHTPFDPMRPLLYEQDLVVCMEKSSAFVEELDRLIRESLPGGTDVQLSNMDRARQVAYRLLVMRYVETRDEAVFQRVQDLFHIGLQALRTRSRGQGSWEANWFYAGPDIVVHYADTNDQLWALVAGVLEEASTVGMEAFFSNCLHLNHFTDAMAKLQQRFVNDPSARQLIVEKLHRSEDNDISAHAIPVIAAFPDTESLPLFMECLADDTQSITEHRTIIWQLGDIGSSRIKGAFPNAATAFRKFITRQIEKCSTSSSHELISECILLTTLLYEISPDEGVKAIADIVTLQSLPLDDVLTLVTFCKENGMEDMKQIFFRDFAAYDVFSRDDRPEYLESLRDWGMTDAMIVQGYVSLLSQNPADHTLIMERAFRYIASPGFDADALDQHHDVSVNGDSTALTAWRPFIETAADAGSQRYAALLLHESSRDSLTPDRIERMVGQYIHNILDDIPRSEFRVDHPYSEILMGVARIPEARQCLLSLVEAALRRFDSDHAIRENRASPRLLHFLLELQTNILMFEMSETTDEVSPELRSWLFFQRDFRPPVEIAHQLFAYSLNDRSRTSTDRSTSFDNHDQYEAVNYVKTVLDLVGGGNPSGESLVSLHDLETYINQLVVGRRIPQAALEAAYAFIADTPSRIILGNEMPTTLDRMKYPIIGITSGGMNHQGVTFKALAQRLCRQYSGIARQVSSLKFGQEAGTDRDMEITFFLSAFLRLRKPEVIQILNNHLLQDSQNYTTVCRFASMGAAEAEADGQHDVVLQMCRVLLTIVQYVPEDSHIEGMTKDEFRLRLMHKIEQLEARLQ